MTCFTEVSCTSCNSTDILKAGFNRHGEQRYRCRDTGRVLQISKTTIIRILKSKAGNLVQVNPDIKSLKLGADKRLTRKTICFSKLEKMHDIVIGLLINKVEFGVDIYAKTHI